jgi:hypothetical protein
MRIVLGASFRAGFFGHEWSCEEQVVDRNSHVGTLGLWESQRLNAKLIISFPTESPGM